MVGRKGKDYLTKDFYDYVVDTYKVKTYKQLSQIDTSLAQRAAKEGWDSNLEKSEPKKGRNYTVESIIQFIKDNNIQKYNDFKDYPGGHGYRNNYKKMLAKGLIEELVKKGKSGIKKGHTYNEADKKKMSEARKAAWVKQKENNFTLNTK